jgi:hypothetical protein
MDAALDEMLFSGDSLNVKLLGPDRGVTSACVCRRAPARVGQAHLRGGGVAAVAYQDRSKTHAESPAHWHEDSIAKIGPGTFIQRRHPS